MEIKLLKHSIKSGGNKARVWYSRGPVLLAPDFKTTGDCVTIYEKDYSRELHKIFADAINDTDSMTDYFEESKVRIFPSNPLFAEACARAEEWAAKYRKAA